MKKLLVALFLLIAISFLTVSAFATDKLSSTSAIATSATSTATPTIDYALPYPGLLPDNPLYFLKAGRDRLIEFLISNPAKKSEFYLLSSDKRLSTGKALIEKGKDKEGVLYVSKSTNYMSHAITSAQQAREQGKLLQTNMVNSIKKHKEVISELIPQVDKKYRAELSNEIKRLSQFELLLSKK